jgi:RNA polymerase sigma-70 factor (family 1)
LPNLDHQDEKELLQKVAAGDEIAFTRLFDAYHQQLGQHIFRLTESRAMAEEIVQDIFLKIWIGREALSGIQHFRSYIFVVARNHTINALRKTIRERRLHRNWEKDTAETWGSADAGDLSKSWNTLIDAAIDQLPPQQKKVFILARQDRLKQEEIARVLQISKSTVKSHMRLAVAAVTEYIRAHADLLSLLFPFFFRRF